MGHTFAELFPEEALERHKLIKRQLNLFEQMEMIPLSKLTVGEMLFFVEITKKFEVTSYDLDILEEILERIKK